MGNFRVHLKKQVANRVALADTAGIRNSCRVTAAAINKRPPIQGTPSPLEAHAGANVGINGSGMSGLLA